MCVRVVRTDLLDAPENRRNTTQGLPVERLQGLDDRFEVAGNFIGRRAGGKSDGRADSNGDFTEKREAAALALHLPDAVEAYGDDGDAKIFGKQADAALEGSHFAGISVINDSFGKNQDAIATIHGFAGKAKTLSKTGKLRERKNVE